MPAQEFQFDAHQTPYYFYDLALLDQTLRLCKEAADHYTFHIHYAFKANFNERILELISSYGIGADCVSGNEVKKAFEKKFPASKIVFAGVGKADWEIEEGLKGDIACFNCESVEELEVLNELAGKAGKKARVAIRVNPNVNANTHHYITTGLDENKFGVPTSDLDQVIETLRKSDNLQFQGLHFHVGSQITDLEVFKNLCIRVNEIAERFAAHEMPAKSLNVGGGLGIDYHQPHVHPIPDFKGYFQIFDRYLERKPGQEVHFELGRSLVGQCGNLITRVLYTKKGLKTTFAIVDAGMTELIRPALYEAYHHIENISNDVARPKAILYDVVGPICESSDSFRKGVELPLTKRGDLLAIRSAGAYGEVMASAYNLRDRVKSYYSEVR